MNTPVGAGILAPITWISPGTGGKNPWNESICLPPHLFNPTSSALSLRVCLCFLRICPPQNELDALHFAVSVAGFGAHWVPYHATPLGNSSHRCCVLLPHWPWHHSWYEYSLAPSFSCSHLTTSSPPWPPVMLLLLQATTGCFLTAPLRLHPSSESSSSSLAAAACKAASCGGAGITALTTATWTLRGYVGRCMGHCFKPLTSPPPQLLSSLLLLLQDPYSIQNGLFYAHIGWMLVRKERSKVGPADIKDLENDAWIRAQHKYYPLFAIFMAFVLPTLVCGLLFGDYWVSGLLAAVAVTGPSKLTALLLLFSFALLQGGYFYAGVARLVFVHHSTFCVNRYAAPWAVAVPQVLLSPLPPPGLSPCLFRFVPRSIAHWLGDADYTDGHSARNSFITALITIGEGYHNFHHEVPHVRPMLAASDPPSSLSRSSTGLPQWRGVVPLRPYQVVHCRG